MSEQLPSFFDSRTLQSPPCNLAVCAERFDPAPAYQTCRFCDYADLCGMNKADGE